MILKLAYLGDPVLRQKTKPIEAITEDIRQLVQDMIETMEAANGIGLAAPQVHRSLALFVAKVPIQQPDNSWAEGKLRVFINPKILSYSEECSISSEGCLSIPKIYVDVIRPHKISIQAMDLEGKIFVLELSGLEARNFMHENDHLNGTLIIDRMDKKERKQIESKLRELKKAIQQGKIKNPPP